LQIRASWDIENVVITSHGCEGRSYTRTNNYELDRFALSYFNAFNKYEDFMSHYKILGDEDGEIANGQYKAICGIVKIVDIMKHGGNLVFTSCYTGQDELFGDYLQTATGKKVNLYINSSKGLFNCPNLNNSGSNGTPGFIKYPAGTNNKFLPATFFIYINTTLNGKVLKIIPNKMKTIKLTFFLFPFISKIYSQNNINSLTLDSLYHFAIKTITNSSLGNNYNDSIFIDYKCLTKIDKIKFNINIIYSQFNLNKKFIFYNKTKSDKIYTFNYIYKDGFSIFWGTKTILE
jgi:hypothetical protein